MTFAERTSARSFPAGRLLAGVDVGGTKVAALVVDHEGAVLGRAVRSMARRAPDASTGPVVAAIRAALEAADSEPADLAAIGVGVPGRVDRDAGLVLVASNLGWVNVPLAAVVEAAIGVPCRIENDVRLAAAGLVDHEITEGARNFAYVAVGTGIGGGLVLDGAVHRGGRGTAGEIGHVIVDPAGLPCPCGQRGCLETIASGPAVLRAAEAALEAGAPSVLRLASNRSAKTVYDAARAGDELALGVVEHAGQVLARSILALVLTCDLERVFLGGGVAASGAVFLDPILAELGRLRAASPLVGQLVGPDSVRLLPARFDAVAWGGVVAARRVAGFGSGGSADVPLTVRDELALDAAPLDDGAALPDARHDREGDGMEEVVARDTEH